MRALLWLCALVLGASAHMSIFHPSVYMFHPETQADELQRPIGPGLEFDDWWFRGPRVRAAAPNVSYELVAGGEATFEIACNLGYTSYFPWPAPLNGPACPSPGPYHADDAAQTVNVSRIAGCALGIANKADINNVTMEDIAIFSVQPDCVRTKLTSFPIPAKMPPCTHGKCICSWLPETGAVNYYMTGFDCHVTGSPIDATPIAPPQPPTWCDPAYPQANKTCVSGSKQPLYIYNKPMNVFNWPPAGIPHYRPRYSPAWSYQPGPQDDIFMPPPQRHPLLGSLKRHPLLPPLVKQAARWLKAVVHQATMAKRRALRGIEFRRQHG